MKVKQKKRHSILLPRRERNVNVATALLPTHSEAASFWKKKAKQLSLRQKCKKKRSKIALHYRKGGGEKPALCFCESINPVKLT